MDDKDKQNLINDYLATVERVQQKNSKREKHQENLIQDKMIFEQVVEQMGLSPEVQSEIKKLAEESLNSAQDHYFRNEFEKSINLAEQSQKLMPYDIRPMELLLRIYSSEHQFADSKKSVGYANQLLKIHPNHEEASRTLEVNIPSSPKAIKKSPVLLLSLSFFTVSLIALILGYGTEQLNDNTTKKSQETEEIIKESKTTETTKANLVEVLEHPPIEFINNTVEGLDISDRGSQYSIYEDAFGYKLLGVVTNNSSEEIKGIKAYMELLDGKGNTIIKKKFQMKPKYRPALRPGESYGFDELIFQKGFPTNYSHPQKVRITLEDIQHNLAAKQISKSKMSIIWPDEQPEQFKLRVMERSNQNQKSPYNDNWTVQKTYEITNIGEGLLKHIKLKLEALDETGEVVGRNESYLVASSKPSMNPDETRLAFFIFQSTKKPVELRLSVLEYR